MTRIKILNSISGVGFSYSPGEVVSVNKSLADDLVAGGHAEKVKTTRPPKKK